MTWQAATFPGVTAFDRRASAAGAVGDYRRTVCRGVGIGLGTVTTAGLMAGTAAVAAAWIVATALHGAPHLHAPLALRMTLPSSLNDRFAALTSASLAPALSRSADAAPLPSAAEIGKGPRLSASLARARVAEGFQALHDIARAVTARASPPVEAAPPSGLVAATFDLFDPEPAYTAALPAAPTAATAQPPQRRLAARAIEAPAPVPSAHPPDAAPTDAQRDTARAAAEPAAPQLAAVTPASPSGLTDFLHKLFGAKSPPAAAPGVSPDLPDADGHTAIYDIEAHTVYLPNGEQLEAHSGLGSMLDDPHYIDKKARGPTPPNVYDLALRDGLFHGVRAIRLNPVSDDRMFGRDGILAHPYMLGPTGQSFGCVSFKDYSQFLQAFERGEVDRLVVVPHLETTASTAAVSRRKQDERYAVND